MATLKHVKTGRNYILSPLHLVGRAPDCLLCVNNPLASANHAEFRWQDDRWELRDLGSRNGTFVNGRQLEDGHPERVSVEAKIAFGDVDDIYQMVDDSHPTAVAKSDHGESLVAEDGFLILPDAENPMFTVFEDGPGRWFVETKDGERRPIENGEQLVTGDRTWTLTFPRVLAKTIPSDKGPLLLSSVGIQFKVSPEEKDIAMTLLLRSQTKQLAPRAWSYLLLTLARARLKDRQNSDLSSSEHGWVYVPDLLELLDTNENQLNVSIFRARRAFARSEILGATGLIERRPGSRQIRLGIANVEIINS